jgi:hypothetical protein
MATQQDTMTNFSSSGGASTRKPSNERRSSRRCKITQLMRIRPSDPEKEHFDDMRGTLFVTMPYTQDLAAMTREYLAEVVRKDELPTGLTGIGIKILMEMGLQQTAYSFGAPIRR